MPNLHNFLQPTSLFRVMTGATVGLSVFTVMAVAQSDGPQSAAAQSASSGSSDSSVQIGDGQKSSGGSSDKTSPGAKGATSKAGGTTTKTVGTNTTAGTTYGSGGSAVTGSTSGGSSAGSTPAPAPSPAPLPAGTYPWHSGIKTTMFWAGEAASADNDFIQNVSSAWQTNWAGYFGGEDTPNSRCGYNPCGFTPNENPFYFALPFGDFTETGPVADLSMVYWYNSGSRAQLNAGNSILKNRWIQITAAPGGVSKTAYAQWEDVGPFNSQDGGYVFGANSPQSTRAGLDVSPAVSTYLGMGGFTTSSWRFVEAADVPAGPWKTTITTSGTDWY